MLETKHKPRETKLNKYISTNMAESPIHLFTFGDMLGISGIRKGERCEMFIEGIYRNTGALKSNVM